MARIHKSLLSSPRVRVRVCRFFVPSRQKPGSSSSWVCETRAERNEDWRQVALSLSLFLCEREKRESLRDKTGEERTPARLFIRKRSLLLLRRGRLRPTLFRRNIQLYNNLKAKAVGLGVPAYFILATRKTRRSLVFSPRSSSSTLSSSVRAIYSSLPTILAPSAANFSREKTS